MSSIIKKTCQFQSRHLKLSIIWKRLNLRIRLLKRLKNKQKKSNPNMSLKLLMSLKIIRNRDKLLFDIFSSFFRTVDTKFYKLLIFFKKFTPNKRIQTSTKQKTRPIKMKLIKNINKKLPKSIDRNALMKFTIDKICCARF